MSNLGDSVDHAYRASGGCDYGVLNVSCATAGTKYAITIPHQSKTIFLQARGDLEFKLYRNSTDTDYVTIKAGTSFGVDLATNEGPVTIGYAEFAANTQVVEAFYLR